MKLSNKAYDSLKWITMVFLPAFIAFYTGLSLLWGWPYGEQIAGTLSLVEVFLGAILQISSAQYKKKVE